MALDFALSEEDKLVQSTVRGVLGRFEAEHDAIRHAVLKEKQFPHKIWDALAEAGIMGAMVPEEFGGSDMGLMPVALATEELARLGFGNALVIVTVMDTCCIVRNGSAEVKDRFLPGIANGSIKLAFAVTEPEAGSNTFRITTRAHREGDEFVVNGQKTFITGADVADYVMLIVRTTSREECIAQGLPKSFGLSILLVPTDAPGLEKHLLNTRGIEGMNQWALYFNDLRVPAVNLVGEENMGAMALFNSLNPERILAGTTSCGLTEYMLGVACDYARERKVFKERPIGAYQGIQHPLAECQIELDAARLMSYRAAWAFDQDLPPGVVGMYSNHAKYLAAELAIKTCDRAIQTLGGNGFSEDNVLIHLWEATRLLRTAPISKEMILNYTAEHVLNLPRSY